MNAEINRLRGELVQLRHRLANYKMKKTTHYSVEYEAWMTRLANVIADVTDNYTPPEPVIPQPEVPKLLEIIKKQALIIETAKIQYPTIHQSLGHIADIYHSVNNDYDKLGTIPTRIIIPVV